MSDFLDYLNNYRILLGSKSPRRAQLMRDAGIKFEIWIKDDDREDYPTGLTPPEIALFLAQQKALAYPEILLPREILVTADTIVILEGDILGKPSSRDEAIDMLQKLSGCRHDVITGVCIRSHDKMNSFSALSAVWFDSLSQSEICYYVDHYQPFDKAGSYGIQEWIGYVGIHEIHGSFYNVMGLPVQRLYQELKEFTNYSH